MGSQIGEPRPDRFVLTGMNMSDGEIRLECARICGGDYSRTASIYQFVTDSRSDAKALEDIKSVLSAQVSR